MTRTLSAVGLTLGLFLAFASSAFAWHGDLTCQRLHIVGTPDHTDWIQNGHNYSDREIAGAWEQDYPVPTPPGYGPVTVHVVPKGDKPYTLTTTESCGVKPVPTPSPTPTPTPTPPPRVVPPPPPVVPPAPPTPPAPPRFKTVIKHVVASVRFRNTDPLNDLMASASNYRTYRLTTRCTPACPHGVHGPTMFTLRVHGPKGLFHKRWYLDGHRVHASSLVHLYSRSVTAWLYDTTFWAPGRVGMAAWHELAGWHRFVFRAEVHKRVRDRRNAR